MNFRKAVLAHITGWLIVQPLYNRLVKQFRKRDMESPCPETKWWWRQQAKAIVDEQERRIVRASGHDFSAGPTCRACGMSRSWAAMKGGPCEEGMRTEGRR